MAEKQLEEFMAAEQQLENKSLTNRFNLHKQADDATNGTATVDGKDDLVAVNETELYRDPNKPVIVGVQMFFSRTGELDMVHQNFFSQFDLVLEWQPVCAVIQPSDVDSIWLCPSDRRFVSNFRLSRRWKAILRIQGISNQIGCQ